MRRGAGFRLIGTIFAGTLGLWSAAAQAQDNLPYETFEVPSPILTIDQDRLFAGTRFGQSVTDELERRAAGLAAENRGIEADLAEEEQALTDARPELPADEFLARADAFDTKVVRIRAEQDAKGRELTTLREAARAAFYREVVEVLGAVVRDKGAVAILDRRAVFLSASSIDITDEAIERIDSAMGEGPGLDNLPLPDIPDEPPAEPD